MRIRMILVCLAVLVSAGALRGAETAKPAAPRDLVAVADGTRVRLTWAAGADKGIVGYEVSRKEPGDEAGKVVLRFLAKDVPAGLFLVETGTRAVGPTAVVDTGLEAGKEYEYTVRAVGSGVGGPASEPSGPVRVKAEPYEFRGEDLVLVVNTASKTARQIAVNYAAARGIRNPQAVQVTAPAGAEISRDDFTRTVLAPVQAHLRSNPRTTVLLLVRGVPWRIVESGKSKNPVRYAGWDRASVESELALAKVASYPIEGKVMNPYFGRAARMSPVESVLWVCRLDGPDDKTANELAGRAMDAEKRGVEGIAFFDWGYGTADKNYAAGDQMIKRAAQVAKDYRLFAAVKTEETQEVADLSQVKEKIGFYYGWYAETFQPKNKAWRFGRGAVALHLHSFAGFDIAADKYWVGPLLAHGATATLGTADEPLLDGFPRGDVLLEALAKGRNFAEASLSASLYLSWMSMNVGDPLYRPFAPKEEKK